jgi:hypothetical protein
LTDATHLLYSIRSTDFCGFLKRVSGGSEMSVRRSLSSTAVVLALIALLAFTHSSWGQEVTAAVVGTVTDPTGAPIKDATVSATDADRGTVSTVKTNDVGAYSLPRLQVGSYSVKVTADGFNTAVVPPFTLVLNQTARVDVQMKIGKVSETVEVTGAAPVLQTESTDVNTLIDANTLVSMPLATRNYAQLTLLTPGAVTPNQSEFTGAQTMDTNGRPFINGNREQANLFLLDGIDNSEDSNNEISYMPNLDAIQEFKVITQNASAEFGNYQGGIVTAALKSGTNSFHGDVFEFLRNDKFNANSWSAGLGKGGPFVPGATNSDGVPLKTKFRWNMFGGTFGGPIARNKVFFFADFQGQRFDFPSSPESHWVYTDAERAGDFGGLLPAIQLVDPTNGNPIPNNNLAAYIASPANTGALAQSPVAAALFASSAYPHAQNQGLADGTSANFQVPGSNAFNNNQGDLKIDYKISDKDSIFGRYSQMRFEQLQATGFKLNGNAPVSEPGRGLSLNWTHALTSTMLNELRTGFNVVDFDQNPSVASLGTFAQQLGISGGNAYSSGMPLVNFSEGGGLPNFGTVALVQIFHTTTGQLSDTLIMSHGRHQIKTGFQYWRMRLDDLYASNQGLLGQFNVTAATGSDLADFWLGSVSSATRGSTPSHVGRRGNLWAGFVQDDWRVTNTLTLNLGLRFEDHQPFYEIHNQAVNFGLYSGAIQVQQGQKSLINNYLGIGDWLPRIGFAWSPSALGGKTVVRGAYGISEYGEGSGVNQQLTQNRPFFGGNTTVQYSGFNQNIIAQGFGPPIPTCSLPVDNTCYAGQNIHVWDPNWRPALVQQWNLTIQHQLNASTSFQIGYVGQHGSHLLNFMTYSQHQLLQPAKYDSLGNLVSAAVIGPGLYFTGNPGLKAGLGGSGNFAEGTASNGAQRYDALQAVLQKQMSSGLEGQVAYTYSKCMTDSGGFFGTWGGQSSTGQIGWQNVYDPAAEWGPCYFDQTHVLSSYVTYELPVGHGKRLGHDLNPVVNAIVGNWEVGTLVNLHTGNALSTNAAGWGNPDPSGTGGPGPLFFAERASCLGAPHYVKKYGSSGPGGGFYQLFDSTNIVAPANGTFGTCSNGNLRGPGVATADISIHKDFLISESKRLEFRSDFVNAFNHPILNAPVLTVPGSDFGHITSSQGAGPGSSRNIQFALKLYF